MHDEELVARLRAGDERAFRELVELHGGRLSRLARSFSRNDAVIEEAVQETWMAVIAGLDRFEGRAPLRAWIFGILVNQARRLAVREYRHDRTLRGTVPGAPITPEDSTREDREPGMGAHGAWADAPVPWGLENPESAMLSRETFAVIERALETLPEKQRQVVLLRDVEGLTPDSVCNILGVSDTNQRVLLHRGRAAVRRALDGYLRDGAPGGPMHGRTGR